MDNTKTGFAIALAWPKTFCKKAGAWYDGLMDVMGFNQNGYYQVGHAAIVLVDAASGNTYYFDFGRYHAPFQHGRVRGVLTDPELAMENRAVVSKKGKIENLQTILEELANRKACHGDGTLYAAVTKINFSAAMEKALEMQKKSPIPYGPFTYGGSNCSRFVNTVIRSGNPSLGALIQLNYPYSLSPTPIGNVRSLGKVHKIIQDPPMVPTGKRFVGGLLAKPNRHPDIPDSSHWLSGEGAGSWFYFLDLGKYISVSRFSPDGELEFSDKYIAASSFKAELPFEVRHHSHYQEITVSQGGNEIKLSKVKSEDIPILNFQREIGNMTLGTNPKSSGRFLIFEN
jgi:hypothetical protein